MNHIRKPRLSSLDVFASMLLATLGVQLQGGCTSEVVVEGNGGSGGAGGAGGAGGSTNTASSSSSSSSSSSGIGFTTSSSSSGFVPGTNECVDPQPIIVNGIDTGVDICAGGHYRRREAVDCPMGAPDPNSCCGVCPEGTICSQFGNEVACSCVPSCTRDADCMANQLCLCGPTGGYCTAAKCRTGADCAAGEECTSWDSTLGCVYLEFVCTTPEDTCSGDKDCNSQVPFSFCGVQPDGHRECQTGGCAIGRPFLIDNEARTANVVSRHDWSTKDLEPNLVGLDERIRDELAEAWEHTARMEHASIAAFARFSLELLSLGAPSDLIERTNAAMVDETRHARVAFALTSAYRGKRIGPGRLPLQGAMDESNNVASILRRVIREGCVGETVAAIEAGEASAHAQDPMVGQTLTMIAADESQHAELAWRTVKWALETFGAEIHAVIQDEIAALESELSTALETHPSLHDELLLQHGVVTPNARESIRRAAIKQVVVPCLTALVHEMERQEATAETALAC